MKKTNAYIGFEARLARIKGEKDDFVTLDSKICSRFPPCRMFK